MQKQYINGGQFYEIINSQNYFNSSPYPVALSRNSNAVYSAPCGDGSEYHIRRNSGICAAPCNRCYPGTSGSNPREYRSIYIRQHMAVRFLWLQKRIKLREMHEMRSSKTLNKKLPVRCSNIGQGVTGIEHVGVFPYQQLLYHISLTLSRR